MCCVPRAHGGALTGPHLPATVCMIVLMEIVSVYAGSCLVSDCQYSCDLAPVCTVMCELLYVSQSFPLRSWSSTACLPRIAYTEQGVLVQEYGTGRFNKKHSTFYAAMMRELGLSDETERYLHLVPWQSLAAMNHNFLLTERRRHYLRYLGGLTFFEVSMHHRVLHRQVPLQLAFMPNAGRIACDLHPVMYQRNT